MQFLTVRQNHSGTERHARQTGSRGQFFAFDYEVSHDPKAESVGVQKDEMWTHREYWAEIKTGVRMGCDEAERQSARLCCTNLLVRFIKFMDVDTTPQLVRARLIDFIQSHVTAWAEPVPPLRAEWLTSDVVALARGIHTNAALDGLPALTDALIEAGCDDPLVMEHLRTCTDHAPSCWVVEMILDQVTTTLR